MSTLSTSAIESRKRTFEDEIEDDMDALFDEMESSDAAVVHGRTIAKPKASLRRAATNGLAIRANEGDFDDAPFLAPMDLDDEGS